MRMLSLTALALAIALLLSGLGLAVNDHNRRQAAVERGMADKATTHAATLDASLERARTITLVMAHNAAFRGFYLARGSRAEKLRRGSTYIDGANDALTYLESLFPTQIGELCFIDRSGSENARVVHGKRAPVSDLSPDEADNPFFRPTFALRAGHVYQSQPYVSPDTHDWVIGNATPIPLGPRRRSVAIVHYELSVESFRRQLRADNDYRIDLVDASTGRVVIDSAHPQRVGKPLGVPGDRRFAALARSAKAEGTATIGGHFAAYRHLRGGVGDANDWLVVAVANQPVTGLLGDVSAPVLAMLAVALLLLTLAALSLRASHRELEAAATSDGLTGLANRRQLIADLERRVARGASDPAVLMLFDLDGFKSYNDSFGHLAGDALLARLGQALARAVRGRARAYRLGGDEFCVLGDASGREEIEVAAPAALAEHGNGFAVTASYGLVTIPDEAGVASDALRLADQRMYAQKRSGRATAGRQSTDVLLRALAERHPEMRGHFDGVAQMARAVGHHLGLEGEALDQVQLAAELHDVGKVAIPDDILNKPGPLDDDEWAFIRRHTIVGERIVAAAPALSAVAKLVRASHEHWDGGGYPDGTAGVGIPLGARIVAVCDSYDAIIAERPYRPARSPAEALAELRRCAGTQFDPAVVEAFIAVLAEARAERGSVADAA